MPRGDVMLDCHTHTSFSHDGRQTTEALFAEAEKKGLEYLAVTEHFDEEGDYVTFEKPDLDAYYTEFERLKAKSRIPKLAFGAEFGYAPGAEKRYLACPYLDRFDVIVNSVHYVEREDPYFGTYFEHRGGKRAAYNAYYRAVRESLEAPYPYQIVGHIGYLLRYAPYADKKPEGDTLDLIDDIFRRAIALDKTVEVNTHTKASGLFSVPDLDALRRYRALGGENLAFSSDAHYLSRVAERYRETADAVKSLGFRYWTVYLGQKPIKIAID